MDAALSRGITDLSRSRLRRLGRSPLLIVSFRGFSRIRLELEAVSVRAFDQFTTYSASKASSYSLSQGLRETLGQQRTHVVIVQPGPVKTDMIESDEDLAAIAEPPSPVANAIFHAIAEGNFHAWTNSMAKQIESAYQSFAEGVVEADISEAAEHSVQLKS